MFFQTVFWSLLIILLGVGLCFAGYRFFRILLPIWGFFAGDPVKIFFLACVIVAGVYGAATVGKKILFVQALPAAIALALVLVAY